jgi:hypothetical protein
MSLVIINNLNQDFGPHNSNEPIGFKFKIDKFRKFLDANTIDRKFMY